MEQQIKEIHKELQQLEELQTKLDRKTKDATAYRTINAQLVSLLKFIVVCTLIISALFCTSVVYLYNESQNSLYNLLSSGTFETVEESKEMSADGNGTIITDIENSSINHTNSVQ